MEYTVLYDNGDGTSKVSMSINGSILEQDFQNGTNSDEFNTNVLAGMAVFNAELQANSALADGFSPEAQTVQVTKLPLATKDTNGSNSDV